MNNLMKPAISTVCCLLIAITAVAQDASHYETATSTDSGDWGLLGLLGLVGLLGLRKKRRPDSAVRNGPKGNP